MERSLGNSTTVLEVIPESPDCTAIVTAPQRPEDKEYTLGTLLPSMGEDGVQFSESALSSEGLSLIYPHRHKGRVAEYRTCEICSLLVVKVEMTTQSRERASGQVQDGSERV